MKNEENKIDIPSTVHALNAKRQNYFSHWTSSAHFRHGRVAFSLYGVLLKSAFLSFQGAKKVSKSSEGVRREYSSKLVCSRHFAISDFFF